MHYKPILHEIQMGDYLIIVTEKKKRLFQWSFNCS